MKKIVCALLCAALLSACVLCGCTADTQGASPLYANAFGGDKKAADTVSAYPKNENELLLFLPSGTDFSSLKVWGAAGAKLNGEKIKNGEVCSVLSADGEYTLTAGKSEYKLTVISSRDVPAIFLTTHSGSMNAIHADKAYKENGSIKVYENGVLTLDGALDYIKGRGNQTWTGEKRPYNIKLSEKASLLGMDAAKKWCLLANATDDTLIRNTVALTLAQTMDIPYAVDFRPADVYINGDYRGSYLVTEKVEVGVARVDVPDLDKLNEEANPGVDIGGLGKLTSGGPADCGNKRWTDIPVSPADISGGYLIEFDGETYYDLETNGFCTDRGQFVTVKSPESASEAEIDYIRGFCNEAEAALAAEDGCNSLGKHYGEYFDVETLAKTYVLNEYLINTDCGFSSTFFSKTPDGKLAAGPAWDFDTCLRDDRTAGIQYIFNAENRCICLLCMNRYNMDATVFELAFRHTDFRQAAKKVWNEYKMRLTGEAFEQLVSSSAEAVKYSAAADHFRWSSNVLMTPEEWTDIFVGYSEKLTELAGQRVPWMDKGLADDTAMLYYDLNGVSGWMFSEKIVCIGESVTVKEMGQDAFLSPDIPDGTVFDGWNMAADGSGESFAPGEEITLNAPNTTLYAVWNKR